MLRRPQGLPHIQDNTSMPNRSAALCSFLCAFALIPAALSAQTPTVLASGENERVQAPSVTGGGNAFTVTVQMADDNFNGSLPTSFRRWWRFRVDNLPTTGVSLTVRVTRAGYTDLILPVWSTRQVGQAEYSAWSRVPDGGTYTRIGSQGSATHSFTVQVPAGVDSVQFAKWFPYETGDKDALVARALGAPGGYVTHSVLGQSWQGRDIDLLSFTDPTVPAAGKRRVWIHTSIHPAENTAFFLAEGLVDWLLSGDPMAETVLDELIIDLVPMANPDGVFLGNYRTNSRSVNLESDWAQPYNSIERELVALRTAIESRMGTPASPAANPIEVLLNLHASHNVSGPFHFRHTSNPGFNQVSSRSGVIPAVNALENAWINAFKARNAQVNGGTTLNSSCGAPTRPFVECMMHDRWTVDPQWSANGQQPVMAITWEGNYGRIPNGTRWNTDADYVAMGADMGKALFDYFGLVVPPPPVLTASFASLGNGCGGGQLVGVGVENPTSFTLAFSSIGDVVPLSYMVVSQQQVSLPLGLPPGCVLGVAPDWVSVLSFSNLGLLTFTADIPKLPGLRGYFQIVRVDTPGGVLRARTTNVVEGALTFQ